MPRFLRRLAEGVFDEEDVRDRALELGDFIQQAREQYGISAPIAVGYRFVDAVVIRGLDEQWRDAAQQHELRDASGAVSGNVAGDVSAAHRRR
ncbi:hypothetical protein JOE51_006776 [Bradyrhizobium japonicum]|nr:hypothetical protein [Bradyrhizobium japonicum]